MTTETEVKLQRYNQVEKEADSFGRILGVRRLKPSEQTKLAGMTSDLTGYDATIDKEGKEVQLPHRMPLMLAAAVCLIDGIHIPFPRNRGELDSIYDRLDIEGLSAASKAWIRLNGVADGVADDPKEEAKN
jgi:hypothetical protein